METSNNIETSVPGANKLSEFLMVVYFRAAKMNITDKDLVSPFLKVSS